MLSPLTYILLLLLVGLLTKSRIRKTAFVLAGILFLVFSNPALFTLWSRWYQPPPAKLPNGVDYAVGMVSGGFGSVDYQGHGYFNASADRFLQAVKLYQEGRIHKVLISGGNSKNRDKNFDEGRWAKQEMMAFGIPDTAIVVEDLSTNTRGNAIHAKRILDSMGVRTPCLLITSAFHMPRALKRYQAVGIEAIPYPCNYTEGRGPISARDFIPSVNTLTGWPKYLKEAAARVVGR